MKTTHAVRIGLFASMLMISCTLASGAEPKEPPQFTLDAMIISAGQNSRLLSVATNATQELRDVALAELLAENEIKLLSAPRITTLQGSEGTISLQSELEYFEHNDDGTFDLKTLSPDESPGIRLTTTMTQSDPGMVEVDLDLLINTLEDRKPIPGVSLDVGQPQIASRNIQTHVTLREGQWAVIGGMQTQDVASGEVEHLMVAIRVTAFDANASQCSGLGIMKWIGKEYSSSEPCARQSE